MSAVPPITLYIQPGFQMPGYPRCISGSPFAIKLQRVLQYKGLDFALEEVGWLERAERLPQLTATGKLPLLAYGDTLLEDSTDIALALENWHPTPPLLPADPELRARCLFFDDWADDVLYWYGIYEQHRMSGTERVAAAYYAGLPEEALTVATERMAAGAESNIMHQGIGRYPPAKVKSDVRRGLDALEVYLERDAYAAGTSLSLADLSLFGQLHRRLAGTNLWLEEEIASRTTLGAWLRRVDAESRS